MTIHFPSLDYHTNKQHITFFESQIANLAKHCSFLRNHTSNMRTFAKKRTLIAFRPLRMADLPTMLDQIDMQRINPFRWDYLIKDVVSLLGANSAAYQTQAF